MTQAQIDQHELLSDVLETAEAIESAVKDLDHGCWGAIDTIRDKAAQLIDDVKPLKLELDRKISKTVAHTEREQGQRQKSRKIESHDKGGMVSSMESSR